MFISKSKFWEDGVFYGAAVCLWVDPWVGCKWRHILSPYVIEKLHLAGFYFLSDIGIPGLTCLMVQQWFTTEFIGFTDPQEIAVWNGYIAILKMSNVRFF